MNVTDSAADRRQARRDAASLAVTGPLATAIVIMVWATTGAGYFWPAWPMLGMSLALLAALWRAFGPPLRRIAEGDAVQAAAGDRLPPM